MHPFQESRVRSKGRKERMNKQVKITQTCRSSGPRETTITVQIWPLPSLSPPPCCSRPAGKWSSLSGVWRAASSQSGSMRCSHSPCGLGSASPSSSSSSSLVVPKMRGRLVSWRGCFLWECCQDRQELGLRGQRSHYYKHTAWTDVLKS